ncbi:MAG: hypothetical protein CM1200mP38_6500 [Dehalococcoidia bacterium]|nr:MAG: hypothetical protein CM1200mP38_6500 [Dehalococcoidia bacterium]
MSNFGDEVQKKSFLPRLAKGDLRGGLALTESSSGTDVQNISTKGPKRMVKSTLLMVPKCSYLMDKMVTHLQF